jgi:hypothetical protein
MNVICMGTLYESGYTSQCLKRRSMQTGMISVAAFVHTIDPRTHNLAEPLHEESMFPNKRNATNCSSTFGNPAPILNVSIS